MQAQTAETANPAFAAARAHFDAIVTQLGSGPLLAASHAEVEDVLHRDGLELMRLLFQDHLTVRAAAEPDRQVTGADQMPRPERRRMQRQLMTRFGPVTVSRLSYGAERLVSLRPMDAELNLPVEHASHGVRRLVAQTASVASFDETLAELRRTTGAATGKRQIEELVERAARDVDAFYAERGALALREATRSGSILVLTTDAKGVVMRPEGLREATRRAAERAEQKLRTRLSAGEKVNRKRMAQVASVYTIAPFVRTPEQIVTSARSLEAARPERPRPQAKRVWASLEAGAREVVARMFDEAERRDPMRRKQWVALVDGSDTQMRLVREEAERRGVRLTIVLDVVHVIEYVWGAAWCFFPKGDAAAEEWVGTRLFDILRGRASHVAAGIRRSATLRGLTRAGRKRADACADYLLKYARQCRYDAYLAAGLPIATGVIEGACRHLVSDRLDITGARWGLEGAEAVLKLRSLRSSGDFDEYWAFHQRRELERIHLNGYAGGAIPQPLPSRTSAKRSPTLRLVTPPTAE
jgi:hypothetical protein